ncbi:MAG: hypothetical protein ABI807_04275 [Sporichthyaceae bacterium]
MLAELDRMLGLLRDHGATTEGPAVDTAGLDRVPALVSGARSAGLDLTVSSSGVPRALGSSADHCAFRVVQEGVTNALRHAPGSVVTIGIDYGSTGLDLAVLSVGRRHTSAYGGTGRGLVGLRERVTALGGRLDAIRPDDESFVLRAHLPATGSAG